MRKRRAIIFDDEVFILNMLREFFTIRGYEVFLFTDPTIICPVYGKGGDVCMKFYPCADVLITDFNMPGLNGLELIEHQARKHCKLDIQNKAVISGYLDPASRSRVEALGCKFVQKPFTLYQLDEWLAGCERRLDLARPLACRRREARYDTWRDVRYSLNSHDEFRQGIAVNVSGSGICLKAEGGLTNNQRVKIIAGDSGPVQQATVRWVRQLEGKGCLVGLHYN